MSRPTSRLREHDALLNRLRSAEGHLHGIIGMLEADEPCEAVLHQLEAVTAALEAAGRALRTQEFRCCAEILLHSADEASRVAEVRRLATLCKLPVQSLLGKLTEKESDEQTS